MESKCLYFLVFIIILAIVHPSPSSKENNLDFELGVSQNNTNFDVLTIDGHGSKIVLDIDAIRYEGLNKVELVNAPGTIILSQTYVNEQITLIDSPHTQIIGNDFTDYVIETSNYSVITVVRSENVTISGNIFSGITLSDLNTVFQVISVLDSPNVKIMENVFTDIVGDGLTQDLSMHLIQARNSSDIIINANQIEQITLVSEARIETTIILVENYHYVVSSGNTISAIYMESQEEIFLTGFNISNEIVYSFLVNSLYDNSLFDISLLSMTKNAHFTGFNIHSVDPVQTDSYVGFVENRIEGILVQSDTTEVSELIKAEWIGISLQGPHNYTNALIKNNQFNTIETIHESSVASIGILINHFNNTQISSNLMEEIGERNVMEISLIDSYNSGIILEDPPFDLYWKNSLTGYDGFDLTVNGKSDLGGEYNPLEGVLIPSSFWELGIYDTQINLSSPEGSDVIDHLNITVQDTTLPVITGTINYEMEEGSQNNLLSYTVRDQNLANVQLFRNGTELTLDYSFAQIVSLSYNIDNLTLGYYEFRLVATDIAGNEKYLLTNVSVIDTQGPVVSFVNASDYLVFAIYSNHSLFWDVSDPNLDVYQIWINGSLAVENEATQLISFYFSEPLVGVYNVTIIVKDVYDHASVSTSFVTVLDIVPPLISADTSVSMYDDEQYEVKWVIVDSSNLGNYTIILNNMIKDEGNVTTNWISYILKDLEEGVYNLTLMIEDIYGNSANNTLRIYVFSSIFRDLTQQTTITSGTENISDIGPNINIPPELLYGAGIIGVGAIGVVLVRRRIS